VVELTKNEDTGEEDVVRVAPISQDRLSELVTSLLTKNGHGE